MKKRNYRFFTSDFETTIYKGQETTEVWASAVVELFTEDVHVFSSIDELFDFFKNQNCDCVFYFHNLKFDGEFWISWLLREMKYKQAYQLRDLRDETSIEWLKDNLMPWYSFKYSISARGQWYSITIRFRDHYLVLRDSLKLLPFSVKRIGSSFKTKHRKLAIEYEGYRKSHGIITPKEREYIANDVLVVKEALEILVQQGHLKSTIGSCCLAEYKDMCKHSFILPMDYDETFPNLYNISLDKQYDYTSAGEYIRKGYRGAWCYLVKGKENKVYKKGLTADVNSLYPSIMHSESGNRYPVGKPVFWKGNYIPDSAVGDNKYYYVRIRTKFYLKPGYLPFIQIKNNLLYKGTECLESSMVYDYENECYTDIYIDENGKEQESYVTMTLTMTDFALIKQHYDLVGLEILDGCWFYAVKGIFDDYINKFKKIKQESKGAVRELAKLFLNNLYGRLATNTDSSFKVAYLKDDGTIGWKTIIEHEKEPGYIACGAAITSYARYFTITHAQMNYHGVDKPGFIYADTDSIHCDLAISQLIGIKVHHTNFNAWKLESYWDHAIFTRQKTYIEHNTHSDGEPVKPYYTVKCAGMPEACKKLFLESLSGKQKFGGNKIYEPEEIKFLFKNGKPVKRELNDFCIGLEIPGKLMPRRLPGGMILVKTTYRMR